MRCAIRVWSTEGLIQPLEAWSDMGVFARIMMGLAEQAPDNTTISIDAAYLKAHRTVSSLGLKKGAWASDRTDQRWDEYKTTRSYRRQSTSCPLLHHCGSRQQLYRRSCIDERRLVLRRPDRQGNSSLYPKAQITQDDHQIR